MSTAADTSTPITNVKMSRKAWDLAVKDYFPTPQLFNEDETGQKTPICYAGAGVTVREMFAIQIMSSLVSQQSSVMDTVEGGEHLLAEKAVKSAEALIEYLANNEPEREET